MEKPKWMERNNSKPIEYEGGVKDKSGSFEKKIYEIQIDAAKAKRQFRLEILGIEVYFPHIPYECQITYMKKGKSNQIIFLF